MTRQPATTTGIPLLGFGTYPLRGAEAERCVGMALEVGYRHIDTAQMYGNEAAVGASLSASGIAREDLYIVTKVDPGNAAASRFRPSVEKSIADLGGPVDLLLIHWPPPAAEVDGMLDHLAEALHLGFTKHIGVSNFSPTLLRRAVARVSAPLVANQIEFHALIDQSAALAEARSLGVALTAYSPLGRGAVVRDPAIAAVAARHNRPASEIALRWIVQQGVAAIPMTRHRENAISNLRALDFTLPDADMASISARTTANRRIVASGKWD